MHVSGMIALMITDHMTLRAASVHGTTCGLSIIAVMLDHCWYPLIKTHHHHRHNCCWGVSSYKVPAMGSRFSRSHYEVDLHPPAILGMFLKHG